MSSLNSAFLLLPTTFKSGTATAAAVRESLGEKLGKGGGGTGRTLRFHARAGGGGLSCKEHIVVWSLFAISPHSTLSPTPFEMGHRNGASWMVGTKVVNLREDRHHQNPLAVSWQGLKATEQDPQTEHHILRHTIKQAQACVVIRMNEYVNTAPASRSCLRSTAP